MQKAVCKNNMLAYIKKNTIKGCSKPLCSIISAVFVGGGGINQKTSNSSVFCVSYGVFIYACFVHPFSLIVNITIFKTIQR